MLCCVTVTATLPDWRKSGGSNGKGFKRRVHKRSAEPREPSPFRLEGQGALVIGFLLQFIEAADRIQIGADFSAQMISLAVPEANRVNLPRHALHVLLRHIELTQNIQVVANGVDGATRSKDIFDKVRDLVFGHLGLH